jgi:hypothetical protein
MTDPICTPSFISFIHNIRACRALRLAGLVLLTAAMHREAQGLNGRSQQLDKAKACAITDIDVDASTDVRALEKYKDSIAELLREEKFEEIDCIADSARSGKKKFAGGMWKLHNVYAGLDKPRKHATEEDWRVHLARLERWVKARPESITARVALAQAYTSFAWDARGGGYSNTVSESGWRLFGERLDKAKAILDDAFALRTKCPEWYLVMQHIAQGQGWEREQATALFQQAIAFEPSYYYFYRMQADYLLPKWHGEEGDSEKFAADSADRIGGSKGDILYFQLAVTMRCICNEEQELGTMSWPRIQKGFADLEKEYGPSLLNQNYLAGLALKANDPVVADTVFRRIGENWDEETWGTESYFKQSKDWAAKIAPHELKTREIRETAEANMRSAEGVQYMKAVNQKVTDMLRECMQTSSGDLQRFEIMLQIGVEGIPENGSMANATPVAVCLFRQFAAARMNKQASFAPPPHPAYWIKLDLDPAALNVASK